MDKNKREGLYTSLALATGQFRLITVYPRFSSASEKEAQPHEELPLRCDLYIASRDNSTHYEALSYTWGDANDRMPLLVNDIEILITRNLRIALEHIRDDFTNSTFWIDALSINQTDDREKTEQVKHMKDVYANALSTRAWLGLPDNESDKAIAELNRVGNSIVSNGTLELMTEFGNLPSGNPERYKTLETMINDRLSDFFETALQDLARTKSLIIAIQAIFSREYWHRVWILQEIVVSPNVRIQCGKSTISFPQLYGGFFSFNLMQMHIISKLHARIMSLIQLSPVGDVEELIGYYKGLVAAEFSPSALNTFGMRRSYQLRLDSRLGPETRGTLAQILARICVTGALKPSSRATDDRDRIYALIGMASDSNSLGIIPDYSMSCSSVYVLAARAIIMSGQVDLLSLSQTRDRKADLPSWVPDWRAEWILRPSGQLPWDTAFCASGDSVLQIPTDVGSMSSGQLVLNGYLIGIVETLGKPWVPHLLDGCITDTPGVAAYLLDVANLCDKSDEKFIKTELDIYANNEDRRRAHIRVPVADQEGYGLSFVRRATQDCDQGYKEVMQDIKQRIGILINRDLDQEVPAEVQVHSATKLSYLNHLGWQRDRRPFLSHNGYVGLAPSHVEENDRIVVFLGGKFPYILRRNGNGTFKFVGEAYVHGIMYGEFMKEEKIISFTIE